MSVLNRRLTLIRAHEKPRDKRLGFVPVHSENVDFSDHIAERPLARRELANDRIGGDGAACRLGKCAFVPTLTNIRCALLQNQVPVGSAGWSGP